MTANSRPMTTPALQDVTLAERLRAFARQWEREDTAPATVAILREAAAALSAQGDAPLSMSMFATRADYDAALAAHGKGND